MNDSSTARLGDMLAWGFNRTPRAVTGIVAAEYPDLYCRGVINVEDDRLREGTAIKIKDNSTSHTLKIAIKRPKENE